MSDIIQLAAPKHVRVKEYKVRAAHAHPNLAHVTWHHSMSCTMPLMCSGPAPRSFKASGSRNATASASAAFVSVDVRAPRRSVSRSVGVVTRNCMPIQMYTKGYPTTTIVRRKTHGFEMYWKIIAAASHPTEAITIGTMMMTAPGKGSCGARTFAVKPAAMKPGAMPSTCGSTITIECRALTVRLTSSTLGTMACKGIRIMFTKVSNACERPPGWSARFGCVLGEMNASRILWHWRCKILRARSTCPTSNCCTASRQPLSASARFTWHKSKPPMQGTTRCSGNLPKFLHVVPSVLPTSSIWLCKCMLPLISSQLPKMNFCALSRFIATASSCTYSSACRSVSAKDSIRRTGTRLTTKAERNAAAHARSTRPRLPENVVHCRRAKVSHTSGPNSRMHTSKSTRKAPPRTSPSTPASNVNTLSLLYSKKLGLAGLLATHVRYDSMMGSCPMAWKYTRCRQVEYSTRSCIT
mmetsp:Transcript_78561/g.240387  ORF Transcript_78561/g.240387 Transcript_78561/m.240387 type:complete len:468 (+) Transcript_78561:270-1673(+)